MASSSTMKGFLVLLDFLLDQSTQIRPLKIDDPCPIVQNLGVVSIADAEGIVICTVCDGLHLSRHLQMGESLPNISIILAGAECLAYPG